MGLRGCSQTAAGYARREREREILREELEARPREYTLRCPTLFRVVSGRGPKVSTRAACVCMRGMRSRARRLYVLRNGDCAIRSRIRDDKTPGKRSHSLFSFTLLSLSLSFSTRLFSFLLFPRDITNELNGLRSATPLLFEWKSSTVLASRLSCSRFRRSRKFRIRIARVVRFLPPRFNRLES